MFKKLNILMDAANPDGSPSGNGSTPPAPSTPQFTTPETVGTSAGTPPATPAPAANQGGQTPNQSQPPQTPEPTKEVDLKGLAPESVKDITDFATAHKLSKEQTQAMIDQRKADNDAIAQEAEALKSQQAGIYTKWDEELKSDKEFGGQNYDQNIHINEKFIGDHMPGLGKLLTDSGKKLPPMIMKEINNVARKLYSENELVLGNAAQAQAEHKNPWDYYGTEQNSKG